MAAENRDPVEPQAWFALALASSMWMMVGIAATAVNVAFPTIEHDFANAARSTLSWGLTGYGITVAALMLLGGRLADRLGRRRVFRCGAGVFMVSSLALALAPTAWVFVAARLGQAIGAALAGPSSMTLVMQRFALSRRLSVIAMWSALGTLGAAIGPSFAALITDWLGWRWIFALPVVVCLASITLAPRLLPEGLIDNRSDGRLDIIGSIVGTVAVGTLAAVIIEGPRHGWTHPAILAGVAVTVALLAVFVHRCRTHATPLLDLTLFSQPNVKAVNAVNVLYSAAGNATWLIYPLLMIQQWDYSLMRTGLALTPFPIATSLTGIFASRLAQRLGTRRVIAYGAMMPAFGLLVQLLVVSSAPGYLALAAGAMIFNIGFGIVYSPITALSLRGVAEEQMGQATAAFNALRQLGGGFGIAIVVAIMGNADVIPMDSFRGAMAATVVMTALGGAVVLTALRVPAEYRTRRRIQFLSKV